MRTHVARFGLLAVALLAAAPLRGQVWMPPEASPAPWVIEAPAAAPVPYAVPAPSFWAVPPFPPVAEAEPFAPEPTIVVPEAWLPRDPGDSLYRAAREALNQRRFAKADTLFGLIRARFPDSGYVGDSYYYQAFALQRLGGREEERRALDLLAEQMRKYRTAATLADAAQLTVRIQSARAQAGVAGAATAVEEAVRRVQAQVARPVTRALPPQCDADQQALRATALSALVSVDAEKARPILAEILKSRDECSANLKRQALLLSARIGGDEEISNMLAVALEDPDTEARAAAVGWLAGSESPVALAAVDQILRAATDAEVQKQALAGLGRQDRPEAVEMLKSFLARKDARVELRAQALNLIGRKNGGTAYLREAYPTLDDLTLKQQALNSIGRSTAEEDRAWLRARVLDRAETLELRHRALDWSMRTEGFKVAAVRQLYAEMEDPDMRRQLIEGISRSDQPEAVDFMIDLATNEKDPEVRQEVIRWLGRSKDPRAADFLLKVIRGETK